jgi:hypothetical protein
MRDWPSGRWRLRRVSTLECGVRFRWSLTLGIVGDLAVSHKREMWGAQFGAFLRMELGPLRVDWVCWELPHPGLARVGHPALRLHGDVLLREGIRRA